MPKKQKKQDSWRRRCVCVCVCEGVGILDRMNREGFAVKDTF